MCPVKLLKCGTISQYEYIFGLGLAKTNVGRVARTNDFLVMFWVMDDNAIALLM